MADRHENDRCGYGHLECGLPVMVAALAEVGIDADACGGDRIFQGFGKYSHAPLCIVPLAFDSDPRSHWRAACIARRAMGTEQVTWADWVSLVVRSSPQGKHWLTLWGCTA